MSGNDDESGQYPSRALDKVVVRLPDGMRDRLKSSAELFGRSMNSEIVKRLDRSFEDERLDSLKLDLPMDLWNVLMVDAHMHDQTMDARVADLLRGFFGKDNAASGQSDYANALDKIAETVSELADLKDHLSDINNSRDVDFVLYFNKVLQIRQFLSYLLNDSASVLSDRLKYAALELEKLALLEAQTFEGRKKDADWRRARQENIEGDDHKPPRW
ncbi:Arc family DNA-binding protein [Rhizobium sp. Leaf341]|uniref:Arc family DNA-binding protein n=1 Tax=Rhizobium sp. Leaf341 TaxID=1736344 RepID=UPI0007124426|nr:Arc family DNA-binding protein [Rhizobium sp. Leaf341]KQR77790.1 hypothetical protein ASG03_15565 [Rhizobium sp. Leaf341]